MGLYFIRCSSYQNRVIAPVADRCGGQGNQRILLYLLSYTQLLAANGNQQATCYPDCPVRYQSWAVGGKDLHRCLQILTAQCAHGIPP